MTDMSIYKYRNRSDQELVLIGVGTVPAGAEFTSAQQIDNPNVEPIEVQAPEDSSKVSSVQAPQPGMVTDVQPINNTEQRTNE